MSTQGKPKVANPGLPRNELGLNRRDYEGSMSTLCAGCGHDSVTAAIVQACFELALPPQSVVMCHPGFVDAELERLDPLTRQREREYAYLAGVDFPEMLRRNGVALA